MAKRGLGKGLSSLIPTLPDQRIEQLAENATSETSAYAQDIVGCDELFPNPFQPRNAINDDGLLDLAASIKQHGVIQPVLVRRSQNGFQIIAGERRWRAARLAELRDIPIRILDITDDQALELALVENLQREDLGAMEIARGIHEIISRLSLTHEEIADRIGLSRAAVTNKLRLLQLPEAVIQMLENSEITEGHARTLLALQDADKIIEYANITVQKGLNVRQLEQAVKYASTEPKSDVPIPRQTTTGEFKDKIERLKNNYKLNVSVAASGKGLGVSIKGLEKWQVQLLLEYIDKHGDDLFTRE